MEPSTGDQAARTPKTACQEDFFTFRQSIVNASRRNLSVFAAQCTVMAQIAVRC